MRVRNLVAMSCLLLAPGARAQDVPASPTVVILPDSLLESLEYRDDPRSPVARLEEAVRASFGPRIRSQRAPAPSSRRRVLATGPAHRRATPSAVDVPIAADPALSQSAPSVAASPRRSELLVTAYTAIGFTEGPTSRCLVKRSLDGGRTWSEAVPLPTLAELSACTRTALAYAGNGRRLYAAYTDDRTSRVLGGTTLRVEMDVDIVVAHSDDDGRTWSGPVVALDAAPRGYVAACPTGAPPCTVVETHYGTEYERPSISTPSDGYGPGNVYVTGTRIAASPQTGLPETAIGFARSSDDGRTWDAPLMLDEGMRSPRIVTQGARVLGGPGREVFVAWYHSGDDAFKQGLFEIRVRRSSQAGEAWGDVLIAARDVHELTDALGPSPVTRPWWTGMFPDLAHGRDGRLHVVYASDPEAGSTTAEQGDIRYVSSGGPAYDDWSLPVTVNDDGMGRAQAYPSIVVPWPGSRSAAEVIWEDTRLSSESAAGPPDGNTRYDVFHSRLPWGPDASWSPSLRVSDRSSLQDPLTAGGPNALAANRWGLLFAAWADRRNRISFDDFNEEVWGSRIPPR